MAAKGPRSRLAAKLWTLTSIMPRDDWRIVTPSLFNRVRVASTADKAVSLRASSSTRDGPYAPLLSLARITGSLLVMRSQGIGAAGGQLDSTHAGEDCAAKYPRGEPRDPVCRHDSGASCQETGSCGQKPPNGPPILRTSA